MLHYRDLNYEFRRGLLRAGYQHPYGATWASIAFVLNWWSRGIPARRYRRRYIAPIRPRSAIHNTPTNVFGANMASGVSLALYAELRNLAKN